jgi:hypothetical protein
MYTNDVNLSGGSTGTNGTITPATADADTDLTAAITAATTDTSAGFGCPLVVEAGSYVLATSGVTWPSGNDGQAILSVGTTWAAGNTEFLNVANLFPSGPSANIQSLDAQAKTFDSTWNAGASDLLVMLGRTATSTSDQELVAIYGNAIADSSTADVFGANFIGEVLVTDGAAVALQVGIHDSSEGGASSTAGIVIAATGTQTILDAILVQVESGTNFKYAFHLNSDSNPPMATTGVVISAENLVCDAALDFAGGTFSGHEMVFPSFQVLATPSGTPVPLLVTGGNATTNPSIKFTGGNLAFSGTAAISRGATTGFPMMPTCAGTPDGTPANLGNGNAPYIYDTTAHKLWVYDNIAGAWYYFQGTVA